MSPVGDSFRCPYLVWFIPKSATDVRLDQSTLCAPAELEGSSFLLRPHHFRGQHTDTGSLSRAPRERAQFQVLEYGEPGPGEVASVWVLYLRAHTAYSYLNLDKSWPTSPESCLAVWWSFCLPTKLSTRSRTCGRRKELWALYGIRRRCANSPGLGCVLYVVQVFMESTTDVHELLSQYAEEIQSSVSLHNNRQSPPFIHDTLSPLGKGCTSTRRRWGKTVRRAEFF